MDHSPSFNQNSFNSLADIADRVVQELQIDNGLKKYQDIFSFIENDQQEFEFPLFGVDMNSLETSTKNMMYDEQISPKYPLFDQTLLQSVDINSSNNFIKSETETAPAPAPAPARAPAPAPAPSPAPAPDSVLVQTSALAPGSTSGRLSLMKLFIEDCNNSASTSSSDEDDLDLLSPETYCAWEPKKPATTPRGKHKKSNSISIEVGNTSKKWNVRDVFKRSYSDDNYTVNTTPVVLCLPPISSKVMKKNNEKVSTTKGEKNSKGGSNNKPEDKLLRPTYKGKIGNIRLPAYLPYRHEQIGVYGNGSNNNMHWY